MSVVTRLLQKARDEVQPLHLKVSLARACSASLPPFGFSRARTGLLRLAGLDLGADTVFRGAPRISGTGDLSRKLRIGARCAIDIDCYFELGDSIQIGDDVAFGPGVIILTSTHETNLGTPRRRAVGLQTRPVVVEDSVRVGARATLLPGVRIGTGAIVAAGAMVNRDVPAHTLVAGVPARFVREV